MATMKFERGCRQEIAEVEVQDGFILKDFIDKIERMMAGFDLLNPEKLEVCFETFSDCEYTIRMRISQWRPETDEEMNERAARILKSASAQETKERAMLKALQDRYGS